jgi:hypothetical protein
VKARPIAPLETARLVPGAQPYWVAAIPGVPSSENIQRRMHWRDIARENERFHWHLKLAFSGVPKATGFRSVLFVRMGPGLLDEGDGLQGSYKGIRDLLRPQEVQSGVHGPRTKNPGKAWSREISGTGMVIGDGPGQARFLYRQVRVSSTEPLKTLIVIADGDINLDMVFLC